MLTSLNVDLKYINDVRKTAIINDELLRLNVVIAALQTYSEIISHLMYIARIICDSRIKIYKNTFIVFLSIHC